MSWKPPVTSADRLRAKLDDEFETVAKPEGLRRTSDLRRAAESAASSGPDPDGPAPQDGGAPASQWQRSSERRAAGGRGRRGRGADADTAGEGAGRRAARGQGGALLGQAFLHAGIGGAVQRAAQQAQFIQLLRGERQPALELGVQFGFLGQVHRHV